MRVLPVPADWSYPSAQDPVIVPCASPDIECPTCAGHLLTVTFPTKALLVGPVPCPPCNLVTAEYHDHDCGLVTAGLVTAGIGTATALEATQERNGDWAVALTDIDITDERIYGVPTQPWVVVDYLFLGARP
jgi:hypothetical protein